MERTDFAEQRKRFAKFSILELIDLLESDDLSTRFLAEMSLRDATGI
jgi:hypothetical protein